jgi:hypothetical protein
VRTLECEFIRTMHNQGTAGRRYHYLYTGKRDIRAGDHAMVHNGSEFGIVEVKRVRPGITDKVEKHVLAVVTQEDFLRYSEANRGIDEHRTVFDRLDQMLEDAKRFDKYKELAASNPEADALLAKARTWHGPVIDAILEKPFSMDETKAERPVTREDIEGARPYSASEPLRGAETVTGHHG